ncbi:hypothetical protein H0X48_05315 [Candidatus Dependentiae bacterium]|nr:hypothetical protein [Candidatus Dependentiae bacterium]
MDIHIEIISQKIVIVDEIPCAKGKITIGDFEKRFNIALEYWSIDDYKRQWKEGLERIKTHDKSCLVYYVQDPSKLPYIGWWRMYKIDNKVYVRNSIIFTHLYKNKIGDKRFTPETCYDFISDRNPKEKVSEWIVELD